MISIIICSRTSTVSLAFASNVADTIGVEYELVVIDNSANRHSIFSAYNEGIARAKGDILCFMHEDLFVHTRNWGVLVEDYLKDESIGMLGVVGSHVIPSVGDWRVGFTQYHVLSFVQRIPTFGIRPKYIAKLTKDGIDERLVSVAALDGVWFCLRREMFDVECLRFDDKTFGSFHVYDLDISMQVLKTGKRNVVCSDIVLEHFSEGNYSTGFMESLRIFQDKWTGELPAVVGEGIDGEELARKEIAAERKLIDRIARDGDVVAIKKHWAAKAAGQAAEPLTASQISLISFSEFFYVKSAVKWHPSASVIRRLMREYLTDPMMKGKCLLLWKYFVYRILHVPTRKNTMQFPEVEV